MNDTQWAARSLRLTLVPTTTVYRSQPVSKPELPNLKHRIGVLFEPTSHPSLGRSLSTLDKTSLNALCLPSKSKHSRANCTAKHTSFGHFKSPFLVLMALVVLIPSIKSRAGALRCNGDARGVYYVIGANMMGFMATVHSSMPFIIFCLSSLAGVMDCKYHHSVFVSMLLVHAENRNMLNPRCCQAQGEPHRTPNASCSHFQSLKLPGSSTFQ